MKNTFFTEEGYSLVCIFSLPALSFLFDRYWVVKMESCKTGLSMTALATGGDQILSLLTIHIFLHILQNLRNIRSCFWFSFKRKVSYFVFEGSHLKTSIV